MSFTPSNRDFWQRKELCELVGNYGALVYSHSKGEDYEMNPEFSMADLISTRNVKKYEGLYDIMYTLITFRATRSATEAFTKFGDKLLPALSRLSLESSKTELLRLLPVNLFLSQQDYKSLRNMVKEMDCIPKSKD